MRRALLLAAIASCSSSSSSKPRDVSTFVWGAPTLIAYRDGSGAWQTPPRDAAGNYHLSVTGDYQLVVVCSDATGFATKLRERTADDGTTDFVWCMNHGDPFATVAVTGHMVQAGFVSMYDYASSTTGPWDFTLQVTPGTHDLGATGNGKLALRRGLGITVAKALAPIDVDAEGTALRPTPLSIAGLDPNMTVTTEADLYTLNDIVTAPAFPGSTAQLPDPSLIVTSDQLDLYITATDPGSIRTADTWFLGNTSFTMLPALTDITFASDASGLVHAAWQYLPAQDELALALVATGTNFTDTQEVSATPAYLAATGASDLVFAFDQPLPRFQQAWTIDVTKPYTRTFSARADGDVVYTTAYREGVNGAALTGPAPAAGSVRTHLRYSRR
jgi:hypothetical protein